MNNGAMDQVLQAATEEGWIDSESATKLSQRLMELSQSVARLRANLYARGWTREKTADILSTLKLDLEEMAGKL